MSQYGNQYRLNKPPTNKKAVSNERAFENIDNEDKAYWLGYIAADGCVRSSPSNGYRLVIAGIDKELIYGFAEFIGSSHKVNESQANGKPYYTLSIGSKILCLDLSKYNIVQNKTFTLKPFPIDSDLMRHLIRGYLDGDGDICISNDSRYNRKLFSVSFYGTESIVKWFSDYLKESCLLKSSSWYSQGNITRYKRTQNQAIKICKHIYDGSKTFLGRKKSKYIEFIGL